MQPYLRQLFPSSTQQRVSLPFPSPHGHSVLPHPASSVVVPWITGQTTHVFGADYDNLGLMQRFFSIEKTVKDLLGRMDDYEANRPSNTNQTRARRDAWTSPPTPTCLDEQSLARVTNVTTRRDAGTSPRCIVTAHLDEQNSCGVNSPPRCEASTTLHEQSSPPGMNRSVRRDVSMSLHTPNTVHLDESPEDLAFGSIDDLRAVIFGTFFPNPIPLPSDISPKAGHPLPSPPTIKRTPLFSPKPQGGVTSGSLPDEDVSETLTLFGDSGIDTSLIFGDPADQTLQSIPTSTTKLPLNLDLSPLSPLPNILDFGSAPQSSLLLTATNQLKLKRKNSLGQVSSPSPPSKRGRTKKVAVSPEPRKENLKTIRKPLIGTIPRCEPIWPSVSNSESDFQQQFIQCDTCLSWYHYGCVAIMEGDSRLDPNVAFDCPFCENSLDKETRAEAGNQELACSRPNCSKLNKDEYFVEKLVGRRMKETGSEYEWLVKYDGFPINQSTWEVRANIGAYTRLIGEFLEEAREEGLAVDDQLEDMVLLPKAAKYAFLWK